MPSKQLPMWKCEQYSSPEPNTICSALRNSAALCDVSNDFVCDIRYMNIENWKYEMNKDIRQALRAAALKIACETDMYFAALDLIRRCVRNDMFANTRHPASPRHIGWSVHGFQLIAKTISHAHLHCKCHIRFIECTTCLIVFPEPNGTALICECKNFHGIIHLRRAHRGTPHIVAQSRILCTKIVNELVQRRSKTICSATSP